MQGISELLSSNLLSTLGSLVNQSHAGKAGTIEIATQQLRVRDRLLNSSILENFESESSPIASYSTVQSPLNLRDLASRN